MGTLTRIGFGEVGTERRYRLAQGQDNRRVYFVDTQEQRVLRRVNTSKVSQEYRVEVITAKDDAGLVEELRERAKI